MSSQQAAQVVSLQICTGSKEPMVAKSRVKLVEGYGIEGDRHGTSQGVRTARQVLLIDEETLETFGLARGQVRENITTSGIKLHSLEKGQRLALGGEAVLEITGHCAPCAFIDGIRPGLRQELEGQRGMLAFVLRGGAIKVGDGIRILQGAAAR